MHVQVQMLLGSGDLVNKWQALDVMYVSGASYALLLVTKEA